MLYEITVLTSVELLEQKYQKIWGRLSNKRGFKGNTETCLSAQLLHKLTAILHIPTEKLGVYNDYYGDPRQTIFSEIVFNELDTMFLLRLLPRINSLPA
jgi:hypothetical protein